MKLRLITLTAAIFTAAIAFAQPKSDLRPDETVLLYADSFEGNVDPVYGEKISYAGYTMEKENGLTGPETMPANGNLGNVSKLARLDLYFPKKPNGQMVIVCPGGGYSILSTYNEGLYVADWFLSKGITVCVVKYRLPNHNHTVPYADVANAFRYCRANAEGWGVTQIGVMGFSAGGHLAATASNLWADAVTRPDFSILIYPVITLTPGTTHHGTHKNLLGEKNMVKEKYLDRYSLEKQVNRFTPPTFIALCSDDATVPAENSLMYYNKLIDVAVPVEMHIWPTGGHGWGFSSEKFKGKGKDKFAYARAEFEASLERWLEALR
ncbi:MAG: alpha/beta hydrolase [Bacteroidales bacterium]|nr:alpha/beta hydrolase [Bacteroidales bacterium]